MYYTRFETDVCEIILAGDEDGLQVLHMNTGEGKKELYISDDWTRSDDFFEDAIQQIKEYMSGERKCFDIKLNPQGTDYQKKVWKALEKIPYGEVRSYKDLAIAIGNPNASRAVGSANGKNPIPIIVPCHRVIGANGKMTGFAHGIEAKKKLLAIEKV